MPARVSLTYWPTISTILSRSLILSARFEDIYSCIIAYFRGFRLGPFLCLPVAKQPPKFARKSKNHSIVNGFLIERGFLYSILEIVYSITPLGVLTLTTSPCFLPRTAAPIGDFREIFDAKTSTSSDPTIIYISSFFSPFFNR
ncbi:MAG: hypothetical protein RJB39_674 [Candidatus Parcubacteria bacterium]